jgi:hypothetical protein
VHMCTNCKPLPPPSGGGPLALSNRRRK